MKRLHKNHLLFLMTFVVGILLFHGCRKKSQGRRESRHVKKEESFLALRYSLKPLLEKKQRVSEGQIFSPFLGDLVITYVIDRVGTIEPVTEKHLLEWRISKSRLMKESFSSFQATVDPLKFRVGQNKKGYKIAVPDLESIFASTVILLPSFKEGVKKIFGRWEGLMIAIPTRERCWVFMKEDEKTKTKLRDELMKDYGSSLKPLLDRYLLTKKEDDFVLGPKF